MYYILNPDCVESVTQFICASSIRREIAEKELKVSGESAFKKKLKHMTAAESIHFTKKLKNYGRELEEHVKYMGGWCCEINQK